MTDMRDLTPSEREEIRDEAREQVAYEKTVIESTIMKTKFILETLTAAGFCEDHAPGMIEPILMASTMQQISDALTQIATCQDEMLNTLKEMREQHESSQRHLGALAKYGIEIKK